MVVPTGATRGRRTDRTPSAFFGWQRSKPRVRSSTLRLPSVPASTFRRAGRPIRMGPDGRMRPGGLVRGPSPPDASRPEGDADDEAHAPEPTDTGRRRLPSGAGSAGVVGRTGPGTKAVGNEDRIPARRDEARRYEGRTQAGRSARRGAAEGARFLPRLSARPGRPGRRPRRARGRPGRRRDRLGRRQRRRRCAAPARLAEARGRQAPQPARRGLSDRRSVPHE